MILNHEKSQMIILYQLSYQLSSTLVVQVISNIITHFIQLERSSFEKYEQNGEIQTIQMINPRRHSRIQI
ncbi:unnamed protein product [Paramecium sonneborni]|uniref:Uncharacterized protein n=1 Tax=Paramecium sonneborni TaxID=65129 RepID=A0A8S1R575_9CILI|nr:unnamed protein product [Paramecium sonneborni]